MSTETGSTAAAASAGLRGVVAASSAIGDVNGEQGIPEDVVLETEHRGPDKDRQNRRG